MTAVCIHYCLLISNTAKTTTIFLYAVIMIKCINEYGQKWTTANKQKIKSLKQHCNFNIINIHFSSSHFQTLFKITGWWNAHQRGLAMQFTSKQIEACKYDSSSWWMWLLGYARIDSAEENHRDKTPSTQCVLICAGELSHRLFTNRHSRV